MATAGGSPTGPMPPDTSPEDLAWATPRRKPQPIKTFATKLKLSAEPSAPRTYIYAKRAGIGDTLPPVSRTREARGLAHLRDRLEPQSAHHQPAGAARDPQRDRGRMTTARTIGIVGPRPARQRAGAPADRRPAFDPKGYDIDAAKAAAFAKAGGIAASARRGRALRRRAARGVRHRPGRGRGDERRCCRPDAGHAENSCSAPRPAIPTASRR